MKLFTALGPGDIVSAHRAQIRGDAIQETQFIFSGQLLEYCREQGIETLALSYNRRVDSLSDGPLHVENRPRKFEKSSGARFHLSRIAYAPQAILKLTEDRLTYDRLSNACPKLARQFFDRNQSYPAAIDRLIAHLFPKWRLLDNYEPLFARLSAAS